MTDSYMLSLACNLLELLTAVDRDWLTAVDRDWLTAVDRDWLTAAVSVDHECDTRLAGARCVANRSLRK